MEAPSVFYFDLDSPVQYDASVVRPDDPAAFVAHLYRVCQQFRTLRNSTPNREYGDGSSREIRRILSTLCLVAAQWLRNYPPDTPQEMHEIHRETHILTTFSWLFYHHHNEDCRVDIASWLYFICCDAVLLPLGMALNLAMLWMKDAASDTTSSEQTLTLSLAFFWHITGRSDVYEFLRNEYGQGFFDFLIPLATKHASSASLQTNICGIFQRLLRRYPSHSREYHTPFLRYVDTLATSAMETHTDDPIVQTAAIRLMGVRNNNHPQLAHIAMTEHRLQRVKRCVLRFSEHLPLQITACSFFASLYRTTVETELSKLESERVSQFVLDIMKTHIASEDLQTEGLQFIEDLFALENVIPRLRESSELPELPVGAAVASAMLAHPGSEVVQAKGCALFGRFADHQVYAHHVLDNSAIDLMLQAAMYHPSSYRVCLNVCETVHGLCFWRACTVLLFHSPILSVLMSFIKNFTDHKIVTHLAWMAVCSLSQKDLFRGAIMQHGFPHLIAEADLAEYSPDVKPTIYKMLRYLSRNFATAQQLVGMGFERKIMLQIIRRGVQAAEMEEAFKAIYCMCYKQATSHKSESLSTLTNIARDTQSQVARRVFCKIARGVIAHKDNVYSLIDDNVVAVVLGIIRGNHSLKTRTAGYRCLLAMVWFEDRALLERLLHHGVMDVLKVTEMTNTSTQIVAAIERCRNGIRYRTGSSVDARIFSMFSIPTKPNIIRGIFSFVTVCFIVYAMLCHFASYGAFANGLNP